VVVPVAVGVAVAVAVAVPVAVAVAVPVVAVVVAVAAPAAAVGASATDPVARAMIEATDAAMAGHHRDARRGPDVTPVTPVDQEGVASPRTG
jgi:hypothetical protein